MPHIRPKFDFQVVKKNEPSKAPGRVPKREVASSDIIKKNSPKQLQKKQIEPSTNLNQPPQIKQTSRQKFSLVFMTRALPMLLVFALIVGIVQAGAYLNRAQQATGIVLGSATTAYEDLDSANQSLNEQDFSSAKDKFTSAQRNLASAQNELEKFRLLVLLAPPAKGADNILTGAYFLAEAGKNLTRAVQLFDELSVDSAGISTENFTEKLRQNNALIKNSLLMLSYAREKFNSASSLPGEYAETLEHGKEQIALLDTLLTDLVNLEDLYLSFFGTEPRTYLLVFQNYDEMRASGGFIGTYGSLKYENGAIKQLKIESIYNLDGSLTKQIAAPGPFQPDIKKWGMRDANWFADFPTSAKKLLEFYEMESETADGVIALTPKMFEDILKLIGPIEMSQYGVTLTSENFQEVVQTKTSIEYDKKLNQPKKFLDDFAPIMLNRLSNLGKEEWFTMFQMMKDNFLQKHVMVYSSNPDTQSKIAKLGFDGKIADAPHDYLAIFNSNHGGTKTDLDVEQHINFKSKIAGNGTITNTVTITRHNSADLPNKNFMRVLVPQGSTLMESSGFIEKDQLPSQSEGFTTDPQLAEWDKGEQKGNTFVRTEAGKTEFTGWTDTPGKGASVVVFKYEIPLKIKTSLFNPTQSHSLIFQKQPGSRTTQIEGTWELPGKKIEWASANVSQGSDRASFTSLGATDESWGIIINR
jgi:hypothetical protein